jgi:hypothetical protein
VVAVSFRRSLGIAPAGTPCWRPHTHWTDGTGGRCLRQLSGRCLRRWTVCVCRGNHETKNMNKIYGFEGEVKSK